MPTPDQYRRALEVVTATAVTQAVVIARTADTATLIDAVIPLVAAYSDGTASLAADHYDELRESATARQAFRADPVVNLREDKIRRAVEWAAGPMYGDFPDVELGVERLGEVVQLETARPFRDTILTNQQRDPASVGWKRNTSPSECRFCRMLASNGAVYRQATARFAAHPNCNCTASPVFDGQPGQEASTLQYVASQKKRTPAQRAQLRNYLASLPE